MKASIIKRGDRLLIGTGKHWIWRNSIHHWGTVTDIRTYTGVGYQIGSYEYAGFLFRVRWEHRRFGIFPAHSWITQGDIVGVEQISKEVNALEEMYRL